MITNFATAALSAARRQKLSLLLMATLLAVLSSPASADVLTVGLNGGQYASIQQAADAALDGDVLLLMDETFAGATLTNKGITLVADAGSSPRILGDLTVENLAPDKSCVLSGITITSGFSPVTGNVFAASLNLESNAGAVFVENCSILGAGWPAGVTVRFCSAVSFVDCTLTGGSGFDCDDATLCSAGDGAKGLFVRASQVAIEGCTAEGGQGGSYTGDSSGVPANGGRGGDAVDVRSGTVHIADGSLTGGTGGGPNCTPLGGCGSTGLNGYAVVLGSPSAVVSLRDLTLASSISNFAGGSLVTYPSMARRLRGSAPVREGETLTLTFEGEQGDLLSLWLSFDAGWISLPARQGVFQLGFPLAIPVGLGLGALPASGTITLDLTVPPLPTGVEGFPLLMQGLFVSPSEGALLSNPTATVLLSAAF